MSDRQEPRRRLAFGPMMLCTLLGIAVLMVAIRGQAWWGWQGVWPSILTNVGTALLVAAVLFLFERRFTGRVICANRQAVQQAAAEVEENLQHRTDQLAARIDDLQDQIDERMRAKADAQDAVIASLDMPTYETVTAALTEANRLHAFVGDVANVQTSTDPDGIRFAFQWGIYTGQEGPAVQPGLRLEIEALVPKRPGEIGRPWIVEEWHPDEELTDVAMRINAQLQAAGRWPVGDGAIDWSLTMRNLQTSLDLAIASCRGDMHAWHLNGALFELVGTDWALTEAGIENRQSNGVVLAQSDFPRRDGPWGTPTTDSWNPTTPPGADSREWDRLIKRGLTLFPRNGLRLGHVASTWIPYTGQNDGNPAE